MKYTYNQTNGVDAGGVDVLGHVGGGGLVAQDHQIGHGVDVEGLGVLPPHGVEVEGKGRQVGLRQDRLAQLLIMIKF